MNCLTANLYGIYANVGSLLSVWRNRTVGFKNQDVLYLELGHVGKKRLPPANKKYNLTRKLTHKSKGYGILQKASLNQALAMINSSFGRD